ncbi:MAG: SEC-C domain-containing protein [Myxococcales bacterium]|nr:SEC-C domain-containing protein [Myxococcales bacterium]
MTDVRSIVPVDPVEWTFGFVTLTLGSESDDPEARKSSGPIAIMLSGVYPLYFGARSSGTRTQTIEAALRSAMTEPLVTRPMRPSRICTADERAAEVLRSLVHPSVEVRVAPTPELQLLAEKIFEILAPPTFEAFPGLSDDEVRETFAALAAMVRAVPWRTMTSKHNRHFIVEAPAVGLARCAVRFFDAPHKSMVIFPSREQLQTFELLDLYGSDPDESGSYSPTIPVLIAMFSSGSELEVEYRREVLRRQLAVATPSAWPQLGRIEPFDDCDLREVDCRQLRAAATGIEAFSRRHRGRFRKRDSWPAQLTVRHSELGKIVVTGPFESRLPKNPFTRWRRYLAKHPFRVEGQAFSQWIATHTSEARRALSRLDTLNFVGDVLGLMTHWHQKQFLRPWSPAFVEAYLFDRPHDRPANLHINGYEPRSLPELLDAFGEWLEATGRLDAPRARAWREAVESLRARFIEGVERRERAIRCFIARMKLGGPTLHPRSPCLCGSGKRYAECCESVSID